MQWPPERNPLPPLTEARAQRLARAIRALCGVLDLELTVEREAHLAEASASELEALLDAIERDRRWPG